MAILCCSFSPPPPPPPPCIFAESSVGILESSATPETSAFDLSPPIQRTTIFSLSISSISSPPRTTTLPTTTPGAMPSVEHSTTLMTSSQPIYSTTLITPPTSTAGIMPPVESIFPVLVHTPTPSLLPTPSTDNSPARGSPAGAVAGTLVGVILAVVVLILLVLLVVLVLRRRQKKNLRVVNIEESGFYNPAYEGTHYFRSNYTIQYVLALDYHNKSPLNVCCNLSVCCVITPHYLQGVMATTQPVTFSQCHQTSRPRRTIPGSMKYQYLNGGMSQKKLE